MVYWIALPTFSTKICFCFWAVTNLLDSLKISEFCRLLCLFKLAQFVSRNTYAAVNYSQLRKAGEPSSEFTPEKDHSLFQLLPLLCYRTLLKWWMGLCMMSSKESAEKWAEQEQLMRLLLSGKEHFLQVLLESVTTVAPCHRSTMCEGGKTKHCQVCDGDHVTDAVEGKADLSSDVCHIPALALREGWPKPLEALSG